MRLAVLAASIRKKIVVKAPLVIRDDAFLPLFDTRYKAEYAKGTYGWYRDQTYLAGDSLKLSAEQLDGVTEVSLDVSMRSTSGSTGRNMIRILLDDGRDTYIGVLKVSTGTTVLSLYSDGTTVNKPMNDGGVLQQTVRYKVPAGRKIALIGLNSNFENKSTPAVRGFNNLTLTY